MDREIRNDCIISHLDEALEKGWIRPYFQPIIRTITGSVAVAEALARWQDPEYGMLMPADFMPVLEENDLVYKLDCFMLTEALRIQKQRMDDGLQVGTISVNFSRSDFDVMDIASFIQEQVEKYQVERDLIWLEITESTLVKDKDRMISVVKNLRKSGFRVCMDDFGSGYSSLIFLNDYTLDVIKLDIGFLRSFSPVSKEIMRSTVNMAKNLGIKTLAEGVEKEEHVKFLQEIGCDMMQGYYFSVPLPEKEMKGFIEQNHVKKEPVQWKRFYDAADAHVINSDVPLGVLEYDGDSDTYHYLFVNKKQMEQLRSIGRRSRDESEFILNSSHFPMHEKFRALTENAVSKGETAVMYFPDNSFYVRLSFRMVVKQENRVILTSSLVNITEDRTRKTGEIIDRSTEDIALLFEDIHVLDPDNNSADNVLNNFGIDGGMKKNDDLRKGLEIFCNTMVHPDDRKRYALYADADTMKERLHDSPGGILRDYFRILRPDMSEDQKYLWMEIDLLLIPRTNDSKILSCIKSAHSTSGIAPVVRAFTEQSQG
ncbi:MAG: EAL domain-containing protein [Eubacteriales bacterium]